MSSLTALWREHRHRWYRRGIAKEHALRRGLAYYVAQHGFTIGDYSYGAPILRQWGEGSRLIVGRYCSIGSNVEFILGGEHRTDRVTTYPMSQLYGAPDPIDGPSSRGDIVIGSDVWIGVGAMIISGVRIGDGAVIGAHSLVSRDVEPYAVVAGNPARLIRKRFSDDIIGKLLDLRWWELDKDQLRPLLPLLQDNRIEAFIEEFRRMRPQASPVEKAAAEPENETLIPRIHAITGR